MKPYKAIILPCLLVPSLQQILLCFEASEVSILQQSLLCFEASEGALRMHDFCQESMHKCTEI